ncbi:MAG: ribonuclease III family protein, partial [Mycobacteriales bacterium]
GFRGEVGLGQVPTGTRTKHPPEWRGGHPAKLRASVVNTRALAGVARSLELGRWLRLGRGEQGTGGRDKNSILADTMEAVIGAVYLDRSIASATIMVRALFDPLMQAASQGAELDWKTALQELTATRGLGVPDYRLAETGPDHAKSFTAQVHLTGVVHGVGAGRSKKEAEQHAAEAAWAALGAAQELPAPELPAGA